jgi:hypothetical protein
MTSSLSVPTGWQCKCRNIDLEQLSSPASQQLFENRPWRDGVRACDEEDFRDAASYPELRESDEELQDKHAQPEKNKEEIDTLKSRQAVLNEAVRLWGGGE